MSPKSNIAIIAGQLVVGGAERQLFLWLSNLDREKFQPVVVTLHPGCGDYWESPIEALDIPLLRIPRRRNRFLRLLEIVRVLSPYKPQLIHGWHLFSNPYAGMAAKVLGAKSLGSLQSSYQDFCNNRTEALFSWYFTDAIYANSCSAGEQLRTVRKYGMKRQKIYVVQNAVDDHVNDRQTMRHKLSQSFGIPLTDIWIGSLGRLDSGKRFDLLLRAFALLHEEVKDSHFLLMGNGPERSNLESLVRELGITRHVTWTGEIPNANNWLSALDIFCFASLDEGLPNVIMEAAVAGVPVVSWRVPFVEEILTDEHTGLLVDPENIVDLKEAILRLIYSPDLRVKIGNAARSQTAENFSLDICIQRMTQVYDELLAIPKRFDPGKS